MSSSNTKSGSNAASRQGRKKMRILAVLGAVTLLTWSRQLFGGEGDKSPAGGSSAAAAAKDKGDATPAKAAKSAKSILNFEQAMERMTQWPEALNRRVIDGPIEDLSPINWHLDPLESVEPEIQQPASAPIAAAEDPEPATQLVIPSFDLENTANGDDLGIVLRSTVLFGAKRYAVLNGVRYAEGEVILAGGGRYVLSSVRARAVTLSSGDRSWTLVIRDQSTPDNKPEEGE